MTQEEPLYTKLAGELTLSDLGDDRKFVWIHKYKYRGYAKEKIVTWEKPSKVSHAVSTQRVTVTRTARKKDYYRGYYFSSETKQIPWDAEVGVYALSNSS